MNFRKVKSNQIIKYFVSKSFCTKSNIKFKEISIPVPWGIIAAKWWGSFDIKPILCIHGQQDNCGTFNRLIPVLYNNVKNNNISFLTIDLPGHGHSSPYPPGMVYSFISNLIIVNRIVDVFKWNTVSLMGHSLGAMMSFTYSMLYPENVDYTICIDASKPVETKHTAEKCRTAVEKFLKYEKFAIDYPEPPAYTMEEIYQKVTSAHHNSINPEVALHLIERNIEPSKVYPNKFYFKRDSRLKSRTYFEWSTEQLEKDAVKITKPIIVCKAESSSFYEPKENVFRVLDVIKRNNANYEFHMMPGTHHLHLNEPEIIGKYICRFLDKHHTNEILKSDILKSLVM